MKNISLLLATIFIFSSCSGIQEASKVMRNEKIKTTDEFLVKKKDPLVLPPDYDKIPEPGSLEKSSDTKQEDKIKEILKAPIKENVNQSKSSSIEDKILKNIRK